MPRVLAVEDNPDTQTLLRYLLTRHYEVAIVARFDEALAAARQQPFGVYLLDINLGEQRTGIDLLHALRAQAAGESVPAIALTAYAMPGDRERFLEAGFDTYISKPFTRKELLDAIDKVLSSSRSRRT